MGLFDQVKDFFRAQAPLAIDKDQQPSSTALKVATIVLLLETGLQASDFEDEEKAALREGIKSTFGIEDQEVDELLELAESSRCFKGSTTGFTNLINEHYSEDQKQHVLALVWKVIVSDRVIESTEVQMCTRFEQALKLEPEQGKQARKMVAKGLV